MDSKLPKVPKLKVEKAPSIDALPKREKGYRSTVKTPGRKVAKAHAARKA